MYSAGVVPRVVCGLGCAVALVPMASKEDLSAVVALVLTLGEQVTALQEQLTNKLSTEPNKKKRSANPRKAVVKAISKSTAPGEEGTSAVVEEHGGDSVSGVKRAADDSEGPPHKMRKKEEKEALEKPQEGPLPKGWATAQAKASSNWVGAGPTRTARKLNEHVEHEEPDRLEQFLAGEEQRDEEVDKGEEVEYEMYDEKEVDNGEEVEHEEYDEEVDNGEEEEHEEYDEEEVDNGEEEDFETWWNTPSPPDVDMSEREGREGKEVDGEPIRGNPTSPGHTDTSGAGGSSEPDPDLPTVLPSLADWTPRGTAGGKSKNSISSRCMKLMDANQRLKLAHEQMKSSILRVGCIGHYEAGRHTSNVKLTLTVESLGTEADTETFVFDNFEPDHITNLLRFHYAEEFKEIANDSCLAHHFTEKEIRTGKESGANTEAAALEEFRSRNGGWDAKEYFKLHDNCRAVAMHRRKPRRKRDEKARRRDLDQPDC